jgi:hypothetical protein
MTNTLGNQPSRRKTKYDTRSAEELKARVMSVKPKKKKNIESSLEREGIKKLKWDEDGYPTLELTPIRDTVVQVRNPTYYDIMLQIYEVGDWRWHEGEIPTEKDNHWEEHGGSTFLEAGFIAQGKEKIRFGYGSIEKIKEENNNDNYGIKTEIITPEEFCGMQGISAGDTDAIYGWFEKNKRKRESKYIEDNLPF